MPGLTVVRSIADLRNKLAALRREGASLALVPTMGALHAGHLSLVRLGKSQASHVLASLFVNPTQFGPGEDFTAYPRDEARDAALLEAEGCDLLFAPPPEEIYPVGFSTTVTVGGVSDDLEGAVRPKHFAGVATIVTKLLIQAAPNLAVFGEKDYQQLQLVRRLVRDLDLPVRIAPAPIVREPDGLALSSRNVYLDAGQRVIAPGLYRILQDAAARLSAGVRRDQAESAAIEELKAAGFTAIDYLEARDPDTLAPLDAGPLSQPARLLAVARLGRTRLLDNLPVAAPC